MKRLPCAALVIILNTVHPHSIYEDFYQCIPKFPYNPFRP